MKMNGRNRLFVAVATALVTLGFSFFQGFEIDTSNWYADGMAVVNRVMQPSSSTSYNSGTTSPYANGINAASGTWLGRVKSAVSQGSATGSGSCTIDTSGPGSNSSLLCFGPFTDLGLTPAFKVAKPFPSGGYTTQLDIYLDVAYANSHPDCGTASPVGAPCSPNTPGTVNPACITNPNGIDCEGSRFNWTVGLNDPSGNFHRDYVFQVGTAPDPSGSFPSSACPNGYIINAQYNSFRSGGNPYQGFETKCLATSGWYTFQEVFTSVGGFLQVDWSILNSGGTTPATCQDTTGAHTPCTWSRTLSADPISQIGCPSYGWLANEEINDLAIDNTKFTTIGGDCGQPTERSQITPTGTTCQQFASGTATTLATLQYHLKGSTINAVSPGVFFYYTTVSGTKGDTVGISQHSVTPPGDIFIFQSQAVLYSSTCTKIGLLTVNPDGGTASGTLPFTGSFIIGVKYNPTSLKGETPPQPNPPGTANYTFDTSHGAAEVATAQIELEPQ
jgi:hypothetical protein